MTAVEWLIDELGEYFPHEIGGINLMINKAKEMEKQQIINAHFTAQKEDLQFWNEAKQEALEYYNDTFKNTNK